MQRRTLLASMAVAGASLLPSLAKAQDFGGGMSSGVTQALMVGGLSLQTSQLALQRSRNARVRDFAQLEAGEQAAYALAVGAQPGSVPPSQDEAAMLQQLASLSGRQFDRMYIEAQIQGHQQLLQLNAGLAQSGEGGAIRSAAIVAVPSIQTHLYILTNLRRI